MQAAFLIENKKRLMPTCQGIIFELQNYRLFLTIRTPNTGQEIAEENESL